ncbi:hypothetical protein ES332_D05G420800v1 [Gossypium tomentosum]|uniref:Uncharacterized protein n=1 Tax=Gossypium tomentosum TaxID=34277 RepID=A0A5D2L6G1_GOSTO|nr:hypothetical protein ES332_D05G420800v1 [Gossypium tomentosum]
MMSLGRRCHYAAVRPLFNPKLGLKDSPLSLLFSSSISFRNFEKKIQPLELFKPRSADPIVE